MKHQLRAIRPPSTTYHSCGQVPALSAHAPGDILLSFVHNVGGNDIPIRTISNPNSGSFCLVHGHVVFGCDRGCQTILRLSRVVFIGFAEVVGHGCTCEARGGGQIESEAIRHFDLRLLECSAKN